MHTPTPKPPPGLSSYNPGVTAGHITSLYLIATTAMPSDCDDRVAYRGAAQWHALANITPLDLARCHLAAAQPVRGGGQNAAVIAAHRHIGEAIWSLCAGPMDDRHRPVSDVVRAVFANVYPGALIL